jgi:D-3-phosphoglycerate dehydrogenase / 2-oxoglutarate reductase
MKILVSDKLGEKGLEVLEKEKNIQYDVKTGMTPDELKKVIGDYDGIIIRSATKLTKDVLACADKLKAIGRAGVGLDNVDLEAASKRGIIVMNTPGGNTVSTCEHSIAMLLSLSRNIPQADSSLKKKEWKRGQFMGTEVYGKTLGVVGFGRIGKEVSKRMLSFGMKILVYDPFITPESAPQVDVEFVSFDDLCKRADYITMHIPKTAETKYMFNKESFALMKKGVRIVNCARGGIINESDLLAAIKDGTVKGVALDVFEKEPPEDSPLLELDNVIAVPHLGASTEEAQENVGIAVAEQVIDALLGRGVRNAANMPSFDVETMKALQPWISLAERLGVFIGQISLKGAIKSVSIKYSGEVTQYQLTPLTLAIIKGVLSPFVEGEEVNYVNAPVMAKERGIEVVESKSSRLSDFSNAISLEVVTADSTNVVLGTLFANNTARLVRINDYVIDAELQGILLYIHNKDKPGFIGELGTLLGENKVNIAQMTLGRKHEGDTAITIVNTDQEISAETLKKIKALDKIVEATVITF